MPRDTEDEARARDARYRRTSGEHVARYLATGGVEGYDDNSNGAPTLLLFTTGHRTGNEVISPLYYAENPERPGSYVIIASYAGSDTHPKWYLNLAAQPRVDVQIRADRFAATARTADTEEKARLWPLLADRFSFYNGYVEATDRDIPLVVLERDPA